MYTFGYGQLFLDFSGPYPASPFWEGNTEQFIHNADGQLQLNASAAGESSIFTKYKVPADSIQIDLYFKLAFAPSSDNFSKIYLFIDKKSEVGANGYYLKCGENGSNDAIQLWKLTNGIAKLLGSGRMGGIAADPGEARILIKVYRNGLWLFSTDYEGNKLYEDDFEIMDIPFTLPDSSYFGIYCKYTSSRVDKFFYDDISYKTIEKDITPPDLVNIKVENPNRLNLTFSEPIDEFYATTLTNYTIDQGLGSPVKTIFAKNIPNQIILEYTSALISGIEYNLTVTGVRDKAGNQKSQSKSFIYAVRPQKGDILISEVLTDPYSGGEDFVEIYNHSSKFILLDSLQIRNSQKNENKVIRTNTILKQGQYVAISKNVGFLKSTYEPPDTAGFVEAVLPSLNVESANISIQSYLNNAFETIDSFDYQESMHFRLLDFTKGVSLEKVVLAGNTNDANNWNSASTLTKYGTPGYKNSNVSSTVPDNDIGIFPDRKIITPNGDGTSDFVLFNYKLEKPGYLATIRIFDAEGFPVYDLANNVLLGTEGSIKWDGVNSENTIVRLGMYIVMTKLFHTDGESKNYKFVVVVADNF